jgi:flagellar biosynthetic protein FliQ
MTPEAATDLVRHALILCVIIAGPVLIVGLVVGVIISLFQALTQIQEQTVSLIPKLLVMIGVAIVLMPWICQRLMDYTTAMFSGGSP